MAVPAAAIERTGGPLSAGAARRRTIRARLGRIDSHALAGTTP